MNETLMLLSAQIEERRKVIQEDLSSGNAKDYGGYQHACGEVRGYLMIQGYISDLIRALKHGDDDFDSTPTDSVVSK
jgi:hypothetical protein